MIHLNEASTRSCNGYRGNGVWLRKLLENLGRNGIKDHVWKIIKINSPAHSPRRWRRWCRPPPRGETSCPGTIRPPPLSWEPTAEKIHAWPDFPTSRSRTSSQRFPCRFQLARSGSEPSLCPKDSQPTLQLLLREKSCRPFFSTNHELNWILPPIQPPKNSRAIVVAWGRIGLLLVIG